MEDFLPLILKKEDFGSGSETKLKKIRVFHPPLCLFRVLEWLNQCRRQLEAWGGWRTGTSSMAEAQGGSVHLWKSYELELILHQCTSSEKTLVFPLPALCALPLRSHRHAACSCFSLNVSHVMLSEYFLISSWQRIRPSEAFEWKTWWVFLLPTIISESCKLYFLATEGRCYGAQAAPERRRVPPLKPQAGNAAVWWAEEGRAQRHCGQEAAPITPGVLGGNDTHWSEGGGKCVET